MEITPQEVKRRIDAAEPLRLIDVREPFEYQLAHIEGAELIPMREIPQRLQDLDGDIPLIVICHHGVRSLNVTAWLRGQGVENCVSMSGGMDLWSLSIDSGMPRY